MNITFKNLARLFTIVVSIFPLLSIAENVKQKSLFDFSFIQGKIFHDINGDGRKNFSEPSMENITVYLDENNNGKLDLDEISTKTNPSGNYFFTVPSGDYRVRQLLPFGWRNTSGGEADFDERVVLPLNAEDSVSSKVIGGRPVAINQYPYTLALVQKNVNGTHTQFCGGTLISDQWVVTAAHCSVNLSPNSVAVYAGSSELATGQGVFIDVSEIHVHPAYEGYDISRGSDLALWKLKAPIDLEKSHAYVAPLLMEEQVELSQEGELATAVGWGRFNEYSQNGSTILRDVHVPIYNQEECRNVYDQSADFFDKQICIGAPEGGISVCNGDSGGPLLVRDPQKNSWLLAGVTSYGSVVGCSIAGYPNVFTRISKFTEWLQSTAEGQSRFYDLSLSPLQFEKANFANEITARTLNAPITPRWQLVNLVSDADLDNGLVSFSWRILSDSDEYDANCSLDIDGLAPMYLQDSVECYVGENSAQIPGIPDGLYASQLIASSDTATYSRTTDITVGSPSKQEYEGELSDDDQTDPDYSLNNYYVDYYELQGLSGEKAIKIEVTAEFAYLFVTLYDKTEREENGFGGILDFRFVDAPGTTIDWTFVPDANTEYLVGISTFYPQITGAYSIGLLNEGDALPYYLNLEGLSKQSMFVRKKDHQRKIIIREPNVDFLN